MTLKAKILCFAVILSMLLVSLCSCGANLGQIVEVCVDNITTYPTIYLYSFKDAQIDDLYTINIPKMPTATGYIYSKKELKEGDTVNVWSNIRFKDESTPLGYRNGTDAVVDKLICAYEVKVTEKKGICFIEYYTIGTGANSATEQKDLAPVECFKLEVTKERVTIKYKG